MANVVFIIEIVKSFAIKLDLKVRVGPLFYMYDEVYLNDM